MKKKIEQYLPLYLGQKFIMKITNPLSEHKYTGKIELTLDALKAAFATNEDHIDPILVLRPLSSMTEEEAIEIGWGSALAFNAWIKAINQSNNQAVFSIYQFKKLLEWGFDIFGLKEKGLALYPEDL